MRSNWWALVAVVCVAALFAEGCQGCNPPPPVEDAGVDAGEEDAGVDAGPEDAGPDLSCETDPDCAAKGFVDTVCDAVPNSNTEGTCVQKCRIDDDCESYNLGLRCNEQTGHCIQAQGCNDLPNCAQCDPNQGDCPSNPLDYYCNTITGLGCRCVTETNGTGFEGVCRRRRGVCDECTADEQCGGGFQPNPFDPAGRCAALQGDPNGALPDGGTRKYCFYQEASCGCGMIRDPSTGACIPQSASCESIGCSEDLDCPFGSVCDVGNCLCKPRCKWDFSRQELNPPGCPPGQSCWVDSANLDPNSAYFGAGRCEAPCTSNEQCQLIDPRLTCKGETVAGGESAKRCRPDGECMDDLECPELPMSSNYLGYCDRTSFTCKTDCRIGLDPVSSQPYDDCKPGYKCLEENGMNICKQQTCVELGGARLACTTGQHCCGEDRSGDGVAEPCPTAGLDPNKCYTAESPPFCTPCSSHADCQGLPNTNGSTLPSLCLAYKMGAGMCAPATYNDYTLDSAGVSKAFKGCPAKYGVRPITVSCQTNADCDAPGQPGTGTCDEDKTVTLMDGTHPLVCFCTADGTGNSTAGCPGDADAGTQTFCTFAPQGATVRCLQSVVCWPSANIPEADPAMGGCGLP